MMPTRRRPRQRVRHTLVLSLFAAAAGCAGHAALPDDQKIGPVLAGADISSLERIEQAGGVFRTAGQPGDAVAILRARGANVFRLRLFVNPSLADIEVNDLAYTVRMARRIKLSGARLLLDLHYFDTWADPGHQSTPAAWASFDFAHLETTVESWSGDVITQLKQANATPDIVQIGNEIDGGILWPLGQVSGAGNDTAGQWDHFTRLIKAGIRGVRGALGPNDSLRIMLHYSQGGSLVGTQWFMDRMNAYGVPYDIIGLSYYPWLHGTLAALQSNLQAAALRYGRDVMIVETSYPWRSGGWEGMASDRAPMTWTVSPQGQSQFLAAVFGALAAVPGGHGAGVIWWYPEAIQVPGLFIWGGGSLALFDGGGGVLPAASVFGAH